MKNRIAKNDNQISSVLESLTLEEKLTRVKNLYDAEDILEILGYYDGTMDEEDNVKVDGRNNDEIIFEMAIINGNFETTIAYNQPLAGL